MYHNKEMFDYILLCTVRCPILHPDQIPSNPIQPIHGATSGLDVLLSLRGIIMLLIFFFLGRSLKLYFFFEGRQRTFGADDKRKRLLEEDQTVFSFQHSLSTSWDLFKFNISIPTVILDIICM